MINKNNLPESFKIKEKKIKIVLKQLSKYEVIFKGGTSLSLAHGIIERFSEDLDISFYLDDDKDNKTSRKNIKENIIGYLKKLEWVNNVEITKEYILVHFDNIAKPSKYDHVIKPNVIKIELQDPVRRRQRPIGQKIAPYEGADFEMNVADVFSTFVDKTALIFEMTIKGDLAKLFVSGDTKARHLYDILEISKYLKQNSRKTSISSFSKYIKYIKIRIWRNSIKNGEKGISNRKVVDNSIFENFLLKRKSVYGVFERFIKDREQAVLSGIKGVVYPGVESFKVNDFLKAIKTNFKYYERTLMNEIKTKTNP